MPLFTTQHGKCWRQHAIVYHTTWKVLTSACHCLPHNNGMCWRQHAIVYHTTWKVLTSACHCLPHNNGMCWRQHAIVYHTTMEMLTSACHRLPHNNGMCWCQHAIVCHTTMECADVSMLLFTTQQWKVQSLYKKPLQLVVKNQFTWNTYIHTFDFDFIECFTTTFMHSLTHSLLANLGRRRWLMRTRLTSKRSHRNKTRSTGSVGKGYWSRIHTYIRMANADALQIIKEWECMWQLRSKTACTNSKKPTTARWVQRCATRALGFHVAGLLTKPPNALSALIVKVSNLHDDLNEFDVLRNEIYTILNELKS